MKQFIDAIKTLIAGLIGDILGGLIGIVAAVGIFWGFVSGHVFVTAICCVLLAILVFVLARRYITDHRIEKKED